MALKVLIVDDTEHVRQMLGDMLELDGFEVVGLCPDGETAEMVVGERDPDVIVLDYKMPGRDGLSTARTIRATRTNQAIILYSAYVDEALADKARAAGVTLTIGKVEGLGQLERHIRDLCREYSSKTSG